MRVLAADDDPAMLLALVRCLKMWGYDVTEAPDGATAWRLLKSDAAPGMVILDWDMPGFSGLEVCRLLRTAQHGASVYVLMLTGRQDKDDLIQALEAGADDFLSKPFHPRELQLRLARGVALQASRAIPESVRGDSLPSGAVLGGKYRLEKLIGEGGMAKVWLGVHLALGVNVAIKFMKPNVSDALDDAGFEREARAAAQIRSEHVVRIYDHGFTNDGAPYLVMDYLAGESLGDRIERVGPLPLDEVASIVSHVARALVEAHSHGIVHGDVKPNNILLVDDSERPYGCAKLVDFGLAHLRHDPGVRESGFISGTPSYMSPEHLGASEPPNPALDLWGLATTAFTALTGRSAFDGDSLAELVHCVCAAEPPIPSTVNRRLAPAIDQWFARAWARAPERRFLSPSELANTFAEACAAAKATKQVPLAVIGTSDGLSHADRGWAKAGLAATLSEHELSGREPTLPAMRRH